MKDNKINDSISEEVEVWLEGLSSEMYHKLFKDFNPYYDWNKDKTMEVYNKEITKSKKRK